MGAGAGASLREGGMKRGELRGESGHGGGGGGFRRRRQTGVTHRAREEGVREEETGGGRDRPVGWKLFQGQ